MDYRFTSGVEFRAKGNQPEVAGDYYAIMRGGRVVAPHPVNVVDCGNGVFRVWDLRESAITQSLDAFEWFGSVREVREAT